MSQPMLKLLKYIALCWLGTLGAGLAQEQVNEFPYMDDGHPRHVLDVYHQPSRGERGKRPVVVWIHGGGWQTGDKSDVAVKPKYFTDQGMLFVTCNYRLLPEVTMDVLIRDVAQAIGWIHRNAHRWGGDPDRLMIGGHSAGAQLAALLCIDERYLKETQVDFKSLRACIPVDGDTYDIPKIIMTAEHRQMIYGRGQPTFGHRQKFGNDPAKHVDFSAVTHVARGKGIPPFLILYFSGNPDTTVQAQRLESVLREAGVVAKAHGESNSNHSQLNDNLGTPNDPVTEVLGEFLKGHL